MDVNLIARIEMHVSSASLTRKDVPASPFATSPASAPSKSPKFYLIVHHISKKANLGQILRTACAFGVEEVLCVSSKKSARTLGAMGTQNFVFVRYFLTFEDCVAYARAR